MAVSFHPKKNQLFAATTNGTFIIISNVQSKQKARIQQISLFKANIQNTLTCFEMSKTGSRIIIGSYDGSINLFSTKDVIDQIIRSKTGSSHHLNASVLSPPALYRLLASDCSFEEDNVAHNEINGGISCSAFSKDGTGFTIGTNNGEVSFWVFDIDEMAWIVKLRHHLPGTRITSCIANSLSSRVFFAAKGADKASLFELKEERLRLFPELHCDEIHHLAIHPHNPVIFASGSTDAKVILWDASRSTPIKMIEMDTKVRSLLFSKHGLVVGDEGGKISYFEYESKNSQFASREQELLALERSLRHDRLPRKTRVASKRRQVVLEYVEDNEEPRVEIEEEEETGSIASIAETLSSSSIEIDELSVSDQETPWCLNWLLSTTKSSTIQIGDRVVYFPEGHLQFLEQEKRPEFSRTRPVIKHSMLRGRVSNLEFLTGEPSYCMFAIDSELEITYYERRGIPSFIVQAELFDWAMTRPDFVRGEKVIVRYDDDEYYEGKVMAVKGNPRDRPWRCYVVGGWPGESDEAFSPWELARPGEHWPESRECIEEAARMDLQEHVDELIAEPRWQLFLEPVDEELYPDYCNVIAYPVCLRLIRDRLSLGYYRRLQSLLYDISFLYSNAYAYNIPDSPVVIEANELVKSLKSLIRSVSRKHPRH